MNKLLISLAALFLFTVSLYAVEKETIVIKEWGSNKNIEYLEFVKNNNMGNLWSYTIKSVYGELQNKKDKGGYNISISKYLMNCNDKLFLLQKTYLFHDEDLVRYTKYDESYYSKDTGFGWKNIETDKSQIKVSEIFCK